MIRRTVSGVAGEPIAFGAMVLTRDGQAFATNDANSADGIAHRSLLADRVEPGETFDIVVDGDLLALQHGSTRWARVQDGKVTLDD